MELIMISESKLKIMLTSEDMKEYSLNYDNLSYENTETRRAFWSILDEAKHRTGFDAASERVFVQVYPSKKGGCEMYVTKLGILSGKKRADNEDGDIRINDGNSGGNMKKSSEEGIGIAERFLSKRKRSLAFRFDGIDPLLMACKRLYSTGYGGESSAYREDKYFYLRIRDEGMDYAIGETKSVLFEYAEELDSAYFDMYIGEHGSCICESDAVKTLGELGG